MALRTKEVIREDIVQASLRRALSERDEPHAHYAAELEYCDDRLDELAGELVEVLRAER